MKVDIIYLYVFQRVTFQHTLTFYNFLLTYLILLWYFMIRWNFSLLLLLEILTYTRLKVVYNILYFWVTFSYIHYTMENMFSYPFDSFVYISKYNYICICIYVCMYVSSNVFFVLLFFLLWLQPMNVPSYHLTPTPITSPSFCSFLLSRDSYGKVRQNWNFHVSTRRITVKLVTYMLPPEYSNITSTFWR